MQRVNAFIKKFRQPYLPHKIPTSLTPSSRIFNNKENIRPINLPQSMKDTCTQHPHKQAQFQDQKGQKLYCPQCAIQIIKQTSVRLVRIHKSRTYLRKIQEEQLNQLQTQKNKLLNQVNELFDLFKVRMSQFFDNQLTNMNKESVFVEIMKFQEGSLMKDKDKLSVLIGKLVRKTIVLGQNTKNEKTVKQEKQYSYEDIPVSQMTLENYKGSESAKTRKSLFSNKKEYPTIKLNKKRNLTELTTQDLKHHVQTEHILMPYQ